jgi:methylated-DNA-protein-cysteine methyltransferase-like protein
MTGNRLSLYDRIYDMVRRIPHGRVATYGQIARLVGGCTPRMVGYAMAALSEDRDVPWQRVVNREGKASPRSTGHGDLIQRSLLEAEGISFDHRDRLDLARYQWDGPEPLSRMERRER